MRLSHQEIRRMPKAGLVREIRGIARKMRHPNRFLLTEENLDSLRADVLRAGLREYHGVIKIIIPAILTPPDIPS